MAFIRKNFGPLGGQSVPIKSGTAETTPGVPQLYGYRTADAAATVDTANYFAEVGALLEVGDIITRVTINGTGVPQSVGDHVVLSKSQNTDGTWAIDVSDATALSLTDTD